MKNSHLCALGIIVIRALGVLAARTFQIFNACPIDITWYIGGISQGTLEHQRSTTRTMPRDFSSFIYTTANGGNVNGKGTTKAGFFGFGAYYYIVIDPSVRFNAGIEIGPNSFQFPPPPGTCFADLCFSGACRSPYISPPLSFPDPGTPPAPPLYLCPGDNTGYQVVFCPFGRFPEDNPPTTIRLKANSSKCLDLRADLRTAGQPVQIYDCNGSPAQHWRINAGDTPIQLEYTDFCLDGGSGANGAGITIQPCDPATNSKAWFYDEQEKVTLHEPLQGQCLDLKEGKMDNGNPVQVWQCTPTNKNQVWILGTTL